MKAVEEQGAGAPVCGSQPFLQLADQSAGDIDTPHLIAFGIDILVSGVHVLNLKGNQLTDTHSCGGYEAHNKIVGIFFALRQAPLQIFIISLADDMVQIAFLLDADGTDLIIPDPQEFQETIQCPDAYVDGLRLVMIHEGDLIKADVVR